MVETHRHVFGRDAHNGAYFFIAHIFKPEQYDGAVKGAQTVDTLIELADLAGVFVRIGEEVGVLGDRNAGMSSLFALPGEAGIETDFPDPRVNLAELSKGVDAPPKVDEYFLKQVVDLVVIVREHEAHGIDGALMGLNGFCKS